MHSLTGTRKGFTLIELILYIGLSAIIVVVLLRVMLTVLDSRNKAQSLSSVQRDVTFVTERMMQTAYIATNVNTGSSIFQTNLGTLSFKMSTVSVDPTVFFLSGTIVYIQEGSGDPQVLSSSGTAINQLRFVYLTATGSYKTVRAIVYGSGAKLNSLDNMKLDTSLTLRQ